MSSTLKLSIVASAVLVGLSLHTVSAFQTAAGPACTGSGPCAYIISDRISSRVVQGWCAPNGYCADNGALCVSDSSCYNYCSPITNVCGQTEALCDTMDPFSHAQVEVACDTPGYTCNLANNECVPLATLTTKTRKMRARDNKHKQDRRQRSPVIGHREPDVPEGIPIDPEIKIELDDNVFAILKNGLEQQ